ncbi:VOC family protein [Flavitalea antarctica]
MKFLSLAPFIPSGSQFEKSRELFQEIGFNINWDEGDYVGFEKDGCVFILQKFDDKHFAENLMLSVRINSAQEFYDSMISKKLTEKFQVRISKPMQQPYGKEVNLIDLAGVCWHFVE